MNANERTDISANDDWLDRALADDAKEFRADYVADDGFTARVMAELPPAAVALPAWRKPAVFALWTLTAAGAAIALPGAALDVAWESLSFIARHKITMMDVATALLALGAASWAGAAYALRRDD